MDTSIEIWGSILRYMFITHTLRPGPPGPPYPLQETLPAQPWLLQHLTLLFSRYAPCPSPIIEERCLAELTTGGS